MKKLIVILAVLVLTFGCFGSKKDEKSANEAVSNQIETKTKGFVDELKAKYKGKTLIVNFFASWCPPCRGELPDFAKAYEKHKGENFVIVGISVDKTVKDAQGVVDEFKIPYPVYLADNDLGVEMNINTIPTSFIYTPEGKLYDMVVGPLTEKELDTIATTFNK